QRLVQRGNGRNRKNPGRKGGTIGTYNYAGQGATEQLDCSQFFPHSHPSAIRGTNRVRFEISKGPYGEGAAGFILVPYRTVAVDPSIIQIGSVIYVPDARGTSLQLSSGKRAAHDGYFFAADTGGVIKETHIDVFLGISSSNPFSLIKSENTRPDAFFSA